MADDRRAMIERILAAKAGTLKVSPTSEMRRDNADRRAYGLMGFETDTPSGYAGFRGYEIDPLSLPVGADPASDKEFSQDDGGRPVYKTRWGDSYQISPTAQPGGSRVKAAYGAFKNDPIGVAGQIAKAIGGAAWAGFSAPGRAAAGEPVTYGDAIETVGLIGGGGLAKGAASAHETLASRRATLYNLPTETEVGNALGRTGAGGVDLEGRPLVAKHVVGGAPDRIREQSLPAEAVAEIVQGQTGRGIEIVPQVTSGRGDVGSLVTNRYTGEPLRVEVKKGLSPVQTERVAAHETGHLVDTVAGDIPTKGLVGDLEGIYHFGIEGAHRDTKRTLPKHLGYKGDDIPREYMAEAIRQYMAAPDTMKAKYPGVAKAIRAAVNENPRLKDFIQFNAFVGAGLIGLGAAGGDRQ